MTIPVIPASHRSDAGGRGLETSLQAPSQRESEAAKAWTPTCHPCPPTFSLVRFSVRLIMILIQHSASASILSANRSGMPTHPQVRTTRWPWMAVRFSVFAIACLLFSPVQAQERRRGNTEEDEALKPRPVKLTSKDGVELQTFYFPSDKGKEAVPVMIIHEWKGSGNYASLALALRQAGHAALVVEYRGHGNSQNYKDAQGRAKTFSIATMGRRDVEAILRYDLEAAKQFLKKENNAGRLNLNALVLVGSGEGAILAAHWAARDWKFPTVGRIKQGQDVKGLVYVSPAKNVEGIAIDKVMTDRNLMQLPTLVISGTQGSDAKDSIQIAKRLEVMKKRANRGQATGYEYQELPTPLRGAALVKEVSSVIPLIIAFIGDNIEISDSSNEWIERQ